MLRILMERVEGGYFAEVSEAEFGSETDRGGATIAELVNSSLDWAGMDFPPAMEFKDEDSLDDIRKALKAYRAEVAIFTDF